MLDQSDNKEQNGGPEALDGLIETNVIPSLHKEYEIFSDGCSIDRLVIIIELSATVVLRSMYCNIMVYHISDMIVVLDKEYYLVTKTLMLRLILSFTLVK